ncbi:MAG: hypothetical protein LIP05_11715 [Tannerellaceae bacterium]|nr:hypothetical protein [Tannerellaceae bacterium]
MEDRTATTDRPGRQWKYCYANIRDLNDFLARVPREELEELGTDLQRMRGGTYATGLPLFYACQPVPDRRHMG